MKTLFCQQAAEYTYEKFRENVSTAHIIIMVSGQFAEKMCINTSSSVNVSFGHRYIGIHDAKKDDNRSFLHNSKIIDIQCQFVYALC